MAFTDVYDGGDIDVYIATEYDDTAGEWNYERIEYRRGFNPDVPDNTRNVYDKYDLRGKKKKREDLF